MNVGVYAIIEELRPLDPNLSAEEISNSLSKVSLPRFRCTIYLTYFELLGIDVEVHIGGEKHFSLGAHGNISRALSAIFRLIIEEAEDLKEKG